MTFRGMVRSDEHLITFQAVTEMGGGVEEYQAWCHKCDPKGSDLMTVDIRDYNPRMPDSMIQQDLLEQITNHLICTIPVE